MPPHSTSEDPDFVGVRALFISPKSNARFEASRGRPSDRCDPWVPGDQVFRTDKFLPQGTRFFLTAVLRSSGQLALSQLCPPGPSAQSG